MLVIAICLLQEASECSTELAKLFSLSWVATNPGNSQIKEFDLTVGKTLEK